MMSSILYYWAHLKVLPVWQCARHIWVIIPAFIRANLIHLSISKTTPAPIRSPICGWMGFSKLRALQAKVPHSRAPHSSVCHGPLGLCADLNLPLNLQHHTNIHTSSTQINIVEILLVVYSRSICNQELRLWKTALKDFSKPIGNKKISFKKVALWQLYTIDIW